MAWQKQASWEPEAGGQRWRYYCIKMEMGHTVYHRFIKEDYEKLVG